MLVHPAPHRHAALHTDGSDVNQDTLVSKSLRFRASGGMLGLESPTHREGSGSMRFTLSPKADCEAFDTESFFS